MFTKDSVVLSELVRFSKQGFCFVETHNNDSIPMKDVEVIETNEDLFLKGLDSFNDITNTIFATSVKGFTGLDNPEHYIVEKAKYYFEDIRKFCTEENLQLNPEFLYKDVPIYEKVISLAMGKHYKDITVEELAQHWKTCIEKCCVAIENEIISDFASMKDATPGDTDDAETNQEELNAIKFIFNNLISY